MLILNPDPYLLPDYKISPFTTADIHENMRLPDDDAADSYFAARFPGRRFTYTINGRSAINKALSYYKLQKDDVVTILTTTGNFYVSGCVTGEIERYCRWNREVDVSTKVILVIHEFGYPYPQLEQLRAYNLPIIEDVAYAFFSEDANGTIGRVGDFAVYSFPKMFPVQVGGVLVHNKDVAVEAERWEHPQMLPYIKKVLSFHLAKKAEIIANRLRSYNGLKMRLHALGFEERLPLGEGVVPGVFMFRVADEKTDLKRMRDYLFSHGIQCSVFYGERAFFIPVHQSLIGVDLDYFAMVIQSFSK